MARGRGIAQLIIHLSHSILLEMIAKHHSIKPCILF